MQMIVDDFKRHVKNTPDKEMVYFDGKTWSYIDIDSMSDSIASELVNSGVKKGDVVCYFGSRTEKLIASILAIWKLGAIYLPVDTKNPSNRVEQIALQSGAKIVLTDKKENLNYNSLNIRIIASKRRTALCCENEVIDEDTIAYILFTSGTTGTAKGAMITHGGMYNHLLAKLDLLNLSRESRIGQTASIGFDISIWQLIVPIIYGGTIYIIKEYNFLNVRSFSLFIADLRINIVEVVPTYLRLFIKYINTHDVDMTSLTHLMVTGEEFGAKLANECMKVFNEVTIINAYGPTEASDDVTHYVLDKTIKYEKVPIGKPIRNLCVQVMNNNFELAKDEEVGEIIVSGIGVGVGYINAPNETEQVFKSDMHGTKYYLTGDLGYTKEGMLFYAGRKANQYKFNGYRIGIEEIENNIIQIPGVEDVVVKIEKNEDTASSILSATIVSLDDSMNAQMIKSTLKQKLPIYMIPTHISFVNEIKTTINGKKER